MSALTDARRQALKSASHWYAVLSEGEMSARQIQRWQQWYEQDTNNQWAWQQVENLRDQMQVVPGNVAHRALLDTQLTRRRVMKGMLLLLGVGSSWQLWHSETSEGLRADYRTAKGEIRRIHLDDGTLLTLNTDTAANVQFDGQQRLVRLIYGEIALVTGHNGKERPFRVQTQQARLTALGTEFTVFQESGTTLLSVSQHAVEVELAGNPAKKMIVGEGQSLRFSASEFGEMTSLETQAGAWRGGVLSFSDKPLGEVIATLSRYRHGILRCSPSVAALRLSGTFPVKNTDNILSVLEKTLPVKIQYITRYWVQVLPA